MSLQSGPELGLRSAEKPCGQLWWFHSWGRQCQSPIPKWSPLCAKETCCNGSQQPQCRHLVHRLSFPSTWPLHPFLLWNWADWYQAPTEPMIGLGFMSFMRDVPWEYVQSNWDINYTAQSTAGQRLCCCLCQLRLRWATAGKKETIAWAK